MTASGNKFYPDPTNPIFFKRNRIFRVYKGGKLFENFFGEESQDTHFPEEWIASAIEAKNSQSVSGNRYGISIIENSDIYWDQFLIDNRKDLLGDINYFGILIKILDSAVRLPVQVHPDKEFSKNNFSSPFGKEESWIVLSTRENAKIHLGFKDKISKDEFYRAYINSEYNPDSMSTLLNEIPVAKGDVFYIPPRVVHVIGYGCLILEIQEPTDFTIQPEFYCGDYKLNDYEKFLGLSEDIAFNCFDYAFHGKDKIARLKKMVVSENIYDGVLKECLIDSSDTSSFYVTRYKLTKSILKLENGPSVYVVTEGHGIIKSSSFDRKLVKGDYFFLPFAADSVDISTDYFIEVIKCSV